MKKEDLKELGIDTDKLPDLSKAKEASNEMQIKTESRITKEKISKYEFLYDLDNEVYHNSKDKFFEGTSYKDTLSSSTLKNSLTPAHIKMYIERVITENQQRNFSIGNAFHSMFLEPSKFNFFLLDDEKIMKKAEEAYYSEKGKETKSVKSTKIYKEMLAGERNKNTSKAPEVTKQQFKILWEANKRINKDELVMALMEHGHKEVSIFAKLESGLVLSIRPDNLVEVNKDIADVLDKNGYKTEIGDLINLSVKTVPSAEPFQFEAQSRRMNYHLSEAFYFDVLNSIHKDKQVHTIFLTVEKDTGLYMLYKLTDDFISWGRKEYTKRLEMYIETIKSGMHKTMAPDGYEVLNAGSTIMSLDAPKWFYEEITS